jgi:hypothetical protein
LLYRDIVTFSPQIERYYDVFGPDSVHVIVFDDLVKDTARVYEDVLRFLDIDPSFRPGFAQYNKSGPLVMRPSTRFWKTHGLFKQRLDRWTGPFGRYAFDKVVDLWKKPLNRPAKMSPDTRVRLQQEFAEEIKSLGRLLKRDLAHWCEP